MAALTSQRTDTVLEDANVNWDFTGGKKAVMIKAGQYKVPFGLQELISSGSQQLVDRTHLTCHLAILDAGEAVYIEKVEAPGFIKMDTWIGRRMYVHSTSVGKSLVAWLPVAEIEAMLREHGKGTIVNIGSIYGVAGPDLRLYEGTKMGNPAAYAASKGGLIQLTRWLSTVLAPDIRVNCISPGGVFRNQPEAFVQRYVARTPLARMGAEEDLKGAIAYFTSDLSAYVTGENIMVDGGWKVW